MDDKLSQSSARKKQLLESRAQTTQTNLEGRLAAAKKRRQEQEEQHSQK